MPNDPGRAVLRDEVNGAWLEFISPARIESTRCLDDVLPVIRRIEQAVRQEGLFAAGFISYEAAPAFDPTLPVVQDDAFPLLWFGLFEHRREITLPATGSEQADSIEWRPSVTPAEYHRCIEAIHRRIREGDTYQVNFTYRLQGTALDPWRLFLHIAGDGAFPYAGFIDTGEWAVCSASPELFLHIEGDRIESRPMKGTAARGRWFEEDRERKHALLHSEKNRAENLMIVDMVRNDLGRVAHPGSVRTPALFTAERYPAVWQLTSTVAARTDAPLDVVLRAAFPPASITGAPKRRTMEIIADLESTPRRIYTGTMGFLTPGGRVQLNVAIRTVLVHSPTGRAECGIGGGVVWDSTSDGEYDETLAKAGFLNPVPRDFDLLETLLFTPEAGYALLDYHLARLLRSAEYFGFPVDAGTVQAALTAAADLPPEPHRVRVLVSRRGAVRCEAASLPSAGSGFGKVGFAAHPVDPRDVFLYHKTTRRAVYEDALRMKPGYDDVILFNEAGEVTETTIANIAVEIDRVLYTPPVPCGLLPGTLRASLLDQGRMHERVLTCDDVLRNPNVYLLNSVRGMHKVRVSD